ncbi:hypothetical protein COPG_00126 [Colwellia phage 9A]|uniref:Uncharacterized protein n=1 Tax=Colwellia phage 9A TaxID=765765 RepID=I3UMK7_9CAUD|nr:hypothetical protein COPG_00126 [Colwellia phage 9A]AFK66722.1 hypothetical protein COPG_00126 [Colwellia phage 9A]
MTSQYKHIYVIELNKELAENSEVFCQDIVEGEIVTTPIHTATKIFKDEQEALTFGNLHRKTLDDNNYHWWKVRMVEVTTKIH